MEWHNEIQFKKKKCKQRKYAFNSFLLLYQRRKTKFEAF